MNLDRPGTRNSTATERNHLQRLIAQARQWQRLDKQVHNILPANLRPYVQTACIEDNCLILLAANNMAASRLRMLTPGLLPQLQQLDGRIHEMRTRLIPKPPAPVRENRLHLSQAALDSFEHSAEKLQHHPELAAAMQQLAKHHRRTDET